MSRSSLLKKAVDPNEGAALTAPHEVAEYVCAMSIELGAMADHVQLRLLRYLLDMVRLEAETIMRDGQGQVRQPRLAGDRGRGSET